MAISSPYLAGVDRYERTMHGWVDCPRPDTLAITVGVTDPWVAVELSTETSPSPGYTIQAARGRLLVGDPERVDPALVESTARLAGLRMVPGFTRGVGEALGNRPGAQYFVAAAIEVAHLARQVTWLPEEVVRAGVAEGPVGLWCLDMQGWAEFPSSCYTYRPESETLFEEREVQSAMRPVFYAPPVGAARVFNRTKTVRLECRDGRLLLAHSMFDEAHSFQIWYAVDLGSGIIVDAGSLTPRLPYLGICNDPQRNITSLIGQTVDAGLRKRIGVLIGGMFGCAQLHDLTADLLKLLTFD